MLRAQFNSLRAANANRGPKLICANNADFSLRIFYFRSGVECKGFRIGWALSRKRCTRLERGMGVGTTERTPVTSMHFCTSVSDVRNVALDRPLYHDLIPGHLARRCATNTSTAKTAMQQAPSCDDGVYMAATVRGRSACGGGGWWWCRLGWDELRVSMLDVLNPKAMKRVCTIASCKPRSIASQN